MNWLLIGDKENQWGETLGNKCIKTISYNDLNALLAMDDSLYEAVLITAPLGLRAYLCQYFLSRGRHVLCEKPLTLDHQLLRKIFEISDKSKRLIAQITLERFNSNFLSNLKKIKGDLFFTRLELKSEKSKVTDLLVHDLDLFLFFFFDRKVKFRVGFVDKLENTEVKVNDIDLRDIQSCMESQIRFFEDAVDLGFYYTDGPQFLTAEVEILKMVEPSENEKDDIMELELDKNQI